MSEIKFIAVSHDSSELYIEVDGKEFVVSTGDHFAKFKVTQTKPERKEIEPTPCCE